MADTLKEAKQKIHSALCNYRDLLYDEIVTSAECHILDEIETYVDQIGNIDRDIKRYVNDGNV